MVAGAWDDGFGRPPSPVWEAWRREAGKDWPFFPRGGSAWVLLSCVGCHRMAMPRDRVRHLWLLRGSWRPGWSAEGEISFSVAVGSGVRALLQVALLLQGSGSAPLLLVAGPPGADASYATGSADADPCHTVAKKRCCAAR